MKRRFCTAAIGLAVLLTVPAPASAAAGFEPATFWREPADLPFDVAVLSADSQAGISWQSLVYTSEVYRGEPMRVFAYYAWPLTTRRVPAVVDIHGGGANADLQRAQAYARAGYACFSYKWNTWGDAPANVRPGDPLSTRPYTVFGNLHFTEWWQQFSDLGPDYKRPIIYRAVMAARRALTWLSLRPEVDPDRMAVAGHSWGGFLAQLLAGIDPRVRAVVSSAAAGGWMRRYDDGNEPYMHSLSAPQMREWVKRYDPASYAPKIKAPLLLRLAASDFFGSVDTLADYWPSIVGPKSLQLLPAANHTFDDVATRVAWFDHWLKTPSAPPFPGPPKVVLTSKADGVWEVRAAVAGASKIVQASVAWTTSASPWLNRAWAQRELFPLAGAAGSFRGSFAPVAAGGPLRVFVSTLDEAGHVSSCLPIVQPLQKVAAPPPEVNATDVRISYAAASPWADPTLWTSWPAIGPIAQGPEVLGESSATLTAAWDKVALYIRVKVSDRTPWQQASDPARWYNGDSVHLRLRTEMGAGEPKVPESDQHVTHLAWFPCSGPGKVRLYATRGKNLLGVIWEVKPVGSAVVIRAGAGYTFIARIPWDFVDPAFIPAPMRRIRLALFVNQGDLLTDEPIPGPDLNHGFDFKNPDSWGLATLTP